MIKKPKNSDSPFVQWRQKSNLFQGDFSHGLGISKSQLYDLENGSIKIPQKVISVIEESGLDVVLFCQRHQEWMNRRKVIIQQKLKVNSHA